MKKDAVILTPNKRIDLPLKKGCGKQFEIEIEEGEKIIECGERLFGKIQLCPACSPPNVVNENGVRGDEK